MNKEAFVQRIIFLNRDVGLSVIFYWLTAGSESVGWRERELEYFLWDYGIDQPMIVLPAY